jgi:hypothetical protein
MARVAVIALVLAGLVPAVPASAARERGLVVAERVFGLPACGRPAVATARFVDPATLAGSDPTVCEILLNGRYAAEMPPAMRCTLVLHEYGHLAGHEHSADPDSVMYADYLRPDPRCARSFSAASRARRGPGTWGSGPSSG